MSKIRGFEVISLEQCEKDFVGIQDKMYEQILITPPKRGTAKSAGYDIFSTFDFILKPNEEIKIPTGIKAYMMNDEVLKIYPRSSLGFKYHMTIANTVGIIDADYYNNYDNEGHIFIKIHNMGHKNLEIKQGVAFCQAIFEKYLLADGDNFEGKERVGGIGSTTEKS